MRRQFITEQNNDKSLSLSEHELQGVIQQWLHMKYQVHTRGTHTAFWCDNTLVIAWINKLTSKSSPAAATLLLVQALDVPFGTYRV